MNYAELNAIRDLPIEDRKQISRNRYRVSSENFQSVADPAKVAETLQAAKDSKLNPLGQQSTHIHVRSYSPPNWYSTSGVFKKQRQIEAKGLPSFFQWRFLTLTVDRSRFDSPLQAYLACKDDLRRFTTRCRKAGLWDASTPWCWKLEFHPESGWPHWHYLVGRTKKFSMAQLNSLIDLWPHGRPSVEMVRNDDFLYSFKYAFKPCIQQGSDESDFKEVLPDWFMDYFKESVDGSRPETFQRVRFWQTSKAFYTGIPRAPVLSDPKPVNSSILPFTVRENIAVNQSKIHVISRSRRGKYISSTVAILTIAVSHFWNLSAWHAAGNNGVFLSSHSAVIPSHLIKYYTKYTWTLPKHLSANRLTLKQAVKLQAQGETLRKC